MAVLRFCGQQHLKSSSHVREEQSKSPPKWWEGLGNGQSGPVHSAGHSSGRLGVSKQQRGRSGAGPLQQLSGSGPSPGTSSHTSTLSSSMASIAALIAAAASGTDAAPAAPEATLLLVRNLRKKLETLHRVSLAALISVRLRARFGLMDAGERPGEGLIALNRACRGLNGDGERLPRWDGLSSLSVVSCFAVATPNRIAGMRTQA